MSIPAGSTYSHLPRAAARRSWPLIQIALSALLICFSFSVAARAENEGGCSAVAIPPSVTWISSAAGYEGTRFAGAAGVVAVEPVTNQVVLYGPKGQSLNLGTFGQERFLPSSIRRAPNGTYVLRLSGNKLLALNDELDQIKTLGPMVSETGDTGITSLFDWTTADSWLLGFGTVAAPKAKDGYRFGFLTAGLDTLSKPNLFIPADEGSTYLYSQPNFAVIGDKGYFVNLSEQRARLYEVNRDGDWRELPDAIPTAYRRAPELHGLDQGPEGVPDVYAQIQKQKMVAGLFSIQNRLFLLTRKPGGEGRTYWKMYEVRLETGEHARVPIVLPTLAPFITLVPAGDTIYLFDKGKVVGIGNHEIGPLKSFDARWILSPEDSPLLLPRMQKKFVHCSGF